MNSDSRRIESTTAVAVTRASSANATVAGIRFHSVWAAKKVANSVEMAAASSAFAVAGYLRAAFSSQTTSRPMPARMPMTTRTGGCSQPSSSE